MEIKDAEEFEEEFYESLEKKLSQNTLQQIRTECDDELTEAIPTKQLLQFDLLSEKKQEEAKE